LQSHYNYVFDNITNTYNFVTKNSILYRVAFIVDNTFSTISGQEIPNVFQLIVEKANTEVEPFDAKVSKTIVYIIEKFFKNIDNSLIFICSEEREKANLRHNVFDRWYKNSEHKELILKIDNVISFDLGGRGQQKIYTSFLMRKQNPNLEQLIKIYSQIEAILNDNTKL